MYPASCPSEIFVCSANWATFLTSVIIMPNNVCIISVSCTLLFFGGYFCSVFSKRKSVFYVSDQKAWAEKIYRRFQSCHTDYNKIANRGKLGKSGQGKDNLKI